MKILFVSKDGVDLYETLMDSETSRIILTFYEPHKHSLGVFITTSSLGIALSLVSELRWYVRRYMAEVLFELRNDIYGTYSLAREVYERDIRLEERGIRRSLYGIREGKVACIVVPDLQESIHSLEDLSGMDQVLEIWSLEQELTYVFDEKDKAVKTI